MLFRQLAGYFERLEKTTARLKLTEILAELLRAAEAEEIDKIVYLLLGGLAPAYEGVVFNLAERLMVQVIARATGVAAEAVKVNYKARGDLGATIADLKKSAGEMVKLLTVREVHARLKAVAVDEGEKSQERKIAEMATLLRELDNASAKYLVRITLGKLRLGFSEKTILDALSWSEAGDKSLTVKIESAYYVLPDAGRLAQTIKRLGVKRAVQRVKPKVGVPVMPMLSQRLKSPVEMIEKMGQVAVEPKLDGLRILMHIQKATGLSKAFTRNLNETSRMFPELKEIPEQIKAKSVILDCEAVGVDEKRAALVDFQTTMTRRRKYDIGERAKKVGISFHAFDILLKDGESLMELPYERRRLVLEATVSKGKRLTVVEAVVTQDPDVITRLNKQMRRRGLEGIMVKRINSRYVPGRTGWRWVKMKEEEGAQAKLADTVDCLVMGYTRGKGKRAQFGIGQFLVGVADGEKIKTVTKVGTGLTDAQFRELKARLKPLEIKKKPKEYVVDKNLTPDCWVRPGLVVELAADEITRSPIHSAKLALRFPRLARFRDDKNEQQATTLDELKKLAAVR